MMGMEAPVRGSDGCERPFVARLAKIMVLNLVVALLAAGPTHGQVRTLTVDESVRLGLEHNLRLRATGADVEAAHAMLRQARAGALPAIRSQANYTRLSSNIPDVSFMLPGIDSTFTFQAVQLNRFYSEVSVEQPIFNGSRLRNEIRAAEHDARATELRAQQEASDVAFEIRRAYWDLRRATAVQAALASAQERVTTHLADVRSRLEQGAALRRDLLAAQTRRSEVQLERVEADNAVRTGRLELNRLIGLPLSTELNLVDVEPDTSLLAADTLPAAIPTQRPQLRALGEEVSGLRAQRRAAEGDRWPRLDFVGRYIYARPNQYFFSEQDRFRYTWELGFATHWNLWEGGRRSARTGELTARLEAAQIRLDDARAQIAVDVARRRLEVVRAREAVRVALQNVSEAEEAFRVARAQYREGAALSSDVLDAEEAYRRAAARQAQALADYATARAALLNAAGEVW